MTFLIDTHTFLWFINGSDELTKTAKELIEKDNNDVFISIASLWEISIKTAIGKLQISGNYDTVINDVVENDISILLTQLYKTSYHFTTKTLLIES